MKTLNIMFAAVAASAFGAPAHATYYHFEYGYWISEQVCGWQGDCDQFSYDLTGQINTDDAGDGVGYFAPSDAQLMFYTWPYGNLAEFSYDPATLGTTNARLQGGGEVWVDTCLKCSILSNGLYYLAGYKSDAPTGPIGVTRITGFSPAVPEPSCWALMLGGFAMVGGAMRSRRKVAVSFA